LGYAGSQNAQNAANSQLKPSRKTWLQPHRNTKKYIILPQKMALMAFW
jgi:hypothetical protein